MNILLIIFGSLNVVVGIIGIFVPILPTTPFMLLAAACYIRSSDRLYRMLIHNKLLGKYIQNYREQRGMTGRHKSIVIALLWSSILYSALFATQLLWLKIVLIIIAISVTIHILMIRTLKDGKN